MATETDTAAVQGSLEKLHAELANATALAETRVKDLEEHYRSLNTHFDGLKANNAEVLANVEKRATEYAQIAVEVQALKAGVDQVKRELDAPIFKGGKELEDSDRRAAIEVQRRAWIFKGRDPEEFREDTENLINVANYRSAWRKLTSRGGIDIKSDIIKSFTPEEKRAFEAVGVDAAFFTPQMLGLTVDCIIECAELLDLYRQITVSSSRFKYMQVLDYGDIGSYQCDASCDANLGEPGNMQVKNGQTYQFRVIFCFNREDLSESNFDWLDFMFRSAERSYRINRNRVRITGTGVNEPLGWLTADAFTKIQTSGLAFNHQIWRQFLATAPVEYGPVVATMHQNMFAFLSATVDCCGRFIFGDGQMSFSPDDVRERIRISNCLPDATEGGTRGNAANPFVAGAFIAAAGNWDLAYANVSRSPLSIEQFIGGSGRWCVKYQGDAKDGGFVMCPAAARTLVVGA